jgi:hypothetical protein
LSTSEGVLECVLECVLDMFFILVSSDRYKGWSLKAVQCIIKGCLLQVSRYYSCSIYLKFQHFKLQNSVSDLHRYDTNAIAYYLYHSKLLSDKNL